MAAMLGGIRDGDEIIMPSYTFVSTANAFVLRGATPIFVDIRPDTLNIDERLIESVIGARTKAIVPVHYAGVGCEMDKIIELAKKYNLWVFEDAAQAIMARYKGEPLGCFGDLGALSFHETKNVTCGEGGALLINNPKLNDLAAIIRDKGTDRSQFLTGAVDKYTWRSVGSSYLPGELAAAFLLAQLEQARTITEDRLRTWNHYHSALEHLERSGHIVRPYVPDHCSHNGHMYYVLLPSAKQRAAVIDRLGQKEVQVVSHYEPLHKSVAGIQYGDTKGYELPQTEQLSQRIIRLPLWVGMPSSATDFVLENLNEC